ncbi:hypothetical protein TNCV_1331401 [Trichonephila clavipes]|nr:hypothetical protein TNCV_1331401 [Trichonephila clavipes]
MIEQSRNEKDSNHGSIPITIDCNVVTFIVFEGFHQPIKRTKKEDNWSPYLCARRSVRGVTVTAIHCHLRLAWSRHYALWTAKVGLCDVFRRAQVELVV